MNDQKKRGPGRPRKGKGTMHFDLTIPVDVMEALGSLMSMIGISNKSAEVANAIIDRLTVKEKNEKLNEETAQALLGRFQEVIIHSIELVDPSTITGEEEKIIRGPGALVGNAEIFGIWMVTWRPAKYANTQRYPRPWKVMVVKSIAPNTGTPAFMTAPARGQIPVYSDF